MASPISVPPISVLVYLPSQSDTPVNRERVAAALTQLVKAFDVGTLEVDAASQQSWVATFVVRVRALVRQPEVASRLEKMERALQLQAIGRHQAAIDKDEAEGVAALIQALAAVPDATVAIGSLLIVKHTTELGARLVVRNVSEEEQRWVAAAMNVRIDTGIPAGDPLPPQDALKQHIAAECLHELAVGSIEPESAIDRSATCPCV